MNCMTMAHCNECRRGCWKKILLFHYRFDFMCVLILFHIIILFCLFFYYHCLLIYYYSKDREEIRREKSHYLSGKALAKKTHLHKYTKSLPQTSHQRLRMPSELSLKLRSVMQKHGSVMPVCLSVSSV